MESKKTLDQYKKILLKLNKLSETEQTQILRHLMRTDLFFLMWFGFGRRDMEHPWLMDRCYEVGNNRDEFLDLWARDHRKSSIITFGLTIQDILSSHGKDPDPKWNGREPTIGIFSCTRPLAKGFLRQIKREFENNTLLKSLFPDILFDNPHKEASKWSEDDGIVVKRKTNPKESTVEAWGIIDGQPTGKHFLIKVYDDIVTVDNCRSPMMMEKTTESWELSLNLGSGDGISRYIGTRYHFNDTYKTIMDRKEAKPRIYPATEDGSIEGTPVLLEKKELDKKRRGMGSFTFSSQMLLNPLADETQGFKEEWIRYHDTAEKGNMNCYILVDPANDKKKSSDYSVFAVIGLGDDQNYYLLDLVRDRLNLKERASTLFKLHRKWRPLNVGYEQYGIQADIQYMQERMSKENYHFNIQKLGGSLSKNDRIRRLIPLFQDSRFYLPVCLFYTNYEGRTQDLINIFINEEYKAFPVSLHDDILDAIARITDENIGVLFPSSYQDSDLDSYNNNDSGSAWGA